MAANQKRNFKVKHARPVPGGGGGGPSSQHPSGRAPPAPTSEQLLESLRNAIQTTNEIVGGDPKFNNNKSTNQRSNGSFDPGLSPTDGARLKAEPWRGRAGGSSSSENQVIPPPGVFKDGEGWRPAFTRVPEGLVGDDVLLLPPPMEFDVDTAAATVVSGGFADNCDGKDAGRIIGSGLPGNGFVLPPPAVFDNGTRGGGSCIEDGGKYDVSGEKVTGRVVTDDYVHAGGKVEGLPGVTIATASVALPVITVATDCVGGVDVDKKGDILRRGDGEIEGKIIGGLFSVREICALIENDRMFVLQGVMDEESAERFQRKSNSVSAGTGKLQLKQVSLSSSMEMLERKPVSVSSSMEKLGLRPVSAPSSTEKLELKPVSASSSMEKLQLKPVSTSSSMGKLELKSVSSLSSFAKLEHKTVSVSSSREVKPVAVSSGLDVEEVGNDVRAKKAAADAVTTETVTGQNGSCHSDVKGPSSLKVMALDATKKLQVAGTVSLEKELGGTFPTFHEANHEGNSSAANGKPSSESKEVDDLYAKSIPGISCDGIPTGSCITTDAPKVPDSNHEALAVAGKQTAATPLELNKTTASNLDRLSPDPDIMASPSPDKIPPYPTVLEQSKALDYDYAAAVSLEAGARVDRSKTSEPLSPAINTGESESDAGSADGGAVQGSAGVSTTATERNPRPESIVTTHLWSDTAVARVLNVNAGISTDLSKAGLLSETAVKEIKSAEKAVAREEEKSGKKWSLEGKSSTDNNGGDNFSARRVGSKEKRKMEVIRVDVTESMEQTENERHFISKTVKTTMTQETRSAAVGSQPSVGMATNIGARPKAGSMFATGNEVKMEALEDGFSDGMGSNENTGLLGQLRKNRPSGIEGLKETGGAAEKGVDRETGGRIPPGKQSSVFDMLLDQREVKADRNSWSVFERREAARHQTEASSYSAVPSPVNITTSEFNTSVRIPSPSSPTGATPTARIADGKDEVSVTKDSLPSPTTSSPSPALQSRVAEHKEEVSVTKERLSILPASSPSPSIQTRVTERKEEVVRIPRPTSLMVRPGKPPRHSISHPSTPTTQPNVMAHSETTHASSSSVSAPLATPEESFDDVPYSNRSRQSSVGPSRSRQSSVGPCRSRQSSIGSLLGYQSPQSGVSTHFVVVAIDFGTTYSGYAFSFTRDPESIHMMRRWEGGDPGIVNQKTPTTLLLAPDGKFHSFGFAARDFYHDLDPQEAKKWLYFEKFKMTLHHNADLNKETSIKASNGKPYPALSVFSFALTFFKDHALQELSDQSSTTILNEDIRWVITVPAIWKAPAKQFMRQAAYQAGIASADNPNQLLIALEPEAASIYVRKLRLYQLMPDPLMTQLLSKREPTPDPPINRDTNSDDEFASVDSVKYKTLPTSVSYRHSISPSSTTTSVGQEVEIEGTNYMVVDCGGGTVDITVYEMESGFGHLKELHKATGGPYGSLGIDLEFEKLLIGIFGSEFIEAFRTKRPAGWVDLLIAFESRKRTASPFKNNPLNVSLPFSFIDYYKKYKGSQVESAIRKYGNKEVTWSSQGMLRLTPTAMRRLFQPTLDHIKQAIGDVLNNPSTRDIKYMFLVGGFAESAILQMEMRKEFEHLLKILIPQDVGLTILKGAVCFGLDPTIVSVRRSRMTYGVGVLNRFVPDKHPRSKMITKDGAQWCTDVFDKFVEVDQSVAVGETVVRSYAPAKAGQKSTIIHIYSSEKLNPLYITDPGVKRCGTLCLDLTDIQYRHSQKPRRREIQARMTFGDTEIKVTALDVATGKCVRAAIDFMNK